MHELYFSPWSTHLLDSLHYLILRLPVRPFSGLVGEPPPPDPKVYPPSGADGFFPGIFSFTRCIFQRLGYLFYLATHTCSFHTISQGLRSVIEGPFGCFLFRRFEGGSKVVRWTRGRFLHDLALRIYPDIVSGISLVAGLPRPFSRYFLTVFLWDNLGPIVPFW